MMTGGVAAPATQRITSSTSADVVKITLSSAWVRTAEMRSSPEGCIGADSGTAIRFASRAPR